MPSERDSVVVIMLNHTPTLAKYNARSGRREPEIYLQGKSKASRSPRLPPLDGMQTGAEVEQPETEVAVVVVVVAAATATGVEGCCDGGGRVGAPRGLARGEAVTTPSGSSSNSPEPRLAPVGVDVVPVIACWLESCI